jgi:hypothetical protein
MAGSIWSGRPREGGSTLRSAAVRWSLVLAGTLLVVAAPAIAHPPGAPIPRTAM